MEALVVGCGVIGLSSGSMLAGGSLSVHVWSRIYARHHL
jgi:hypothetical protein